VFLYSHLKPKDNSKMLNKMCGKLLYLINADLLPKLLIYCNNTQIAESGIILVHQSNPK